jgi:hypothetical protein
VRRLFAVCRGFERDREVATVEPTAIRRATNVNLNHGKRASSIWSDDLKPTIPRWWLCLVAVAIFGSHARAQVPRVPPLGSRVPEQVMGARTGVSANLRVTHSGRF